MDPLTVRPSARLAYLINHQLVTDEAAVYGVSSGQTDILASLCLIREVEQECKGKIEQECERAVSILHRWNLRVTALASSKIAAAQAAGFELALETSRQSEALFLQNCKTWFSEALLIVSRKTPAPSAAFNLACDFLLFSIHKASYLPEFAREVANAGAVRKFGEGLLNTAASEGCDIDTRVSALDYLCDLLHLSASPLRPLAQHIQSVSLNLLCTWSTNDDLKYATRTAARCLGSVYIVAGKVQASASWRRTVESVLGSLQALFSSMTSTYLPDVNAMVTLPPLDMPPIASSSSPTGLGQQIHTVTNMYKRFESLVDLLILMLASPTERAVAIPVGHLVRFCTRMLNATIYSPVRERHDPALRIAELAQLPSLHIQACRLLGQLLASAGSHMSNRSTDLLGLLTFVETTYPAGSTTKSTIYALASLMVEYTHLHPDDAVKPLSKIVQNIVRDAATFVDPDEGRRAISASNEAKKTPGGQEGRKAKRARLFESDQVMSGRRRTTVVEAEAIEHSLRSLHRILLHAAWLLPSNVLGQVLRLLLAYGLSEPFYNSAPTYAMDALLSEALAYCPSIRVTILQCLHASLQSMAKNTQGVLEHATTVYSRGLKSRALVGDEGIAVCALAMSTIDGLLRPVVPPLVKSAVLRLATQELSGSSFNLSEQKPQDPATDMDGESTEENTAVNDHQDATEYFHTPTFPSQTHGNDGQYGYELESANASFTPQALETRPSSMMAPPASSRSTSAFVAAMEAASASSNASQAPPDIEQSWSRPSKSAGFSNATGNAQSHKDSSDTNGTSTTARTSTIDRDIVATKRGDMSEAVNATAEQTTFKTAVSYGGGAQGEIVRATLAMQQDEDDDTSDEDAPMPRIYMGSDDEEEDKEG